MRAVALFLFGVAILGCSQRPRQTTSSAPPSTQPTAREVAKDYHLFHLMTPQPVVIPTNIAALCVSVAPAVQQAAGTGQGPHADAALNVYMNDPALHAFERGLWYPVGSVIVKEKIWRSTAETSSQTPSHSTKTGLGGMIKRPPGYDSAHGDWEYFYADDHQQKFDVGKIDSCVQCHNAARGKDHVFGSWFTGWPPT